MKKSIRLLALAMLTVMLCLTLASCGGPNADPDKALENLKKNGLPPSVKVPNIVRDLGVYGVDCVVTGTGKIDDEYAHITIIYFEDSASAKDAWEDVQKLADDKKDNDAKDWVCKKSGKMIYFGTKAAVKAAK